MAESYILTRPLNDRLSSLSLDRLQPWRCGGRLDKFCSWLYTKSHPTVGDSWSTITEKHQPERETEPGSFQRDIGLKSLQNVPNQWFIHSSSVHICVLVFNQTAYHQGKVKGSVIKPDSVLQTEGFGFVQSCSSAGWCLPVPIGCCETAKPAPALVIDKKKSCCFLSLFTPKQSCGTN